MTALKNSPRLYAAAEDAGRLPSDTQLTGITLMFNRSAAQQADLDALLAAQQNPTSSQYHKWLTPAQFGARFGMAQADLDKVEQWLQQQGFTIDEVPPSRNFIRFSGTANQLELAFQTQMHSYKTSDGQKHISPSTSLSVPSAIAPTVEGIHDLTGLRPRSSHAAASRLAHPDYTFNNNGTQYVLFAPGDIKVAYDINPLIQGGSDGTGQTIVIAGQSEISTSDITNFQNAAGLTAKAPTLTLVPNTGTAAFVSGDQGESDLDVEWSGATAPGATINFIYTGNSQNSNGVFDSVQYAITNGIGNIISVSYGACETELQLASFSQDTLYQEAAAQGQTIISSSGDFGSTACYGFSNLSTSQQQALGVSYPASSQYVTGVGGTEISTANDAVGTYWGSASNNSVSLTTALSYVPEIAWNDDTLAGQYSPSQGGGLSAGGGGVSILYNSKPDWQSGVSGIPSDNARDVPDVALYSSPDYPGYLYCTSDSSDWTSGQTASCGNSQFYASSGTAYFTIAGGTSFAAPIFAGMVAILNQKTGNTSGQGLINPRLYQLASNAATYTTAFHDVISGNNYCTAGTTYGYCSAGGATEGYAAGLGYDQVTGLGSIDLNNLATAWPSAALTASTTTVSAASATDAVGTGDTITITVASGSSSVHTTPTGSVTVTVDGVDQSPALTLTSGSATYTFTPSAIGSHVIAVTYAGDGTFSTSSGSTTVVAVGGGATATTTTLSASSTSPVYGDNVTLTATVAPSAATGSVNFYDGGVKIGTGTLTAGVATYASSSLTIGAHTLTATYFGDTTYAQSNSNSLTVTVGTPSTSGTGSFTLTATNITVSQGSSGSSTLTITPQSGYTGIVNIQLSTSSSALQTYGCYNVSNATVSGASAVTTSITLYTNATTCANAAVTKRATLHRFVGAGVAATHETPAPRGSRALPISMTALASFLLFGLRRRAKWITMLGCLLLLAGAGLAVGCGGGSSSGGGGGSTSNDVPKGNYTLGVTGADTVFSNINATTSFTLTVD
ncbi:MAG TPA: protease pro-enzyme activation domain-containing protein [Terracidiphilus sp.]|nr:protease pro-enzyme activation domain-containing protein [Terracidiphilus sp.]